MEKVLIIDYGSQYNQLIARRIRENHVFSEVLPHTTNFEHYDFSTVKGIILSGGPGSVYDHQAPSLSKTLLKQKLPILGICYGMQVVVHHLNGTVEASKKREYGRNTLRLTTPSMLTKELPTESTVWMSHGDHVVLPPEGFVVSATSKDSLAIIEDVKNNIYLTQFHPEVTQSEYGKQIIQNFLFDICKTEASFQIEDFITETIKTLKEEVKDEHVILGLSGGVDSSVAAMLLHAAIGKQLTCIFVDTGLLRHNEAHEVMHSYFEHVDLNIVKVDAKDAFFKALKGVTNPEEKRKIIGHLFVEVFERQKKAFKDATFLAQGTIYPDIIESLSLHGGKQTIKSHHNVGGLPDKHSFKIIEPLKELFKDEVREVGRKLGLSEHFITRHPFPGPGLGIRVIGEVTGEKVTILQAVDAIFIEALRTANYYHLTSQAFATLLPVKTVGVMGDKRTYNYLCALRAVTTTDFMTAEVTHLPHAFLDQVATQIVNEVDGVNRVVYDITSKPPGTIEWE